jgi:hypothetical protein
MSKRPSTFKKTDIRRGVEALKSAGLKVVRVVIEGGKLTLVTAQGDTGETTTSNEWDGAVK